MQKFRISIIIFLLAYTGYSSAAEECLEEAFTQMEMNRCAGLSFEAADKELNRVFAEIKVLYSDNSRFLENLKASQLAWIKLRDADLELYYPEKNKRVQYGSAYPMCSSSRKTEITIQRIEFLKQWVKGIEEGGLCSGSIKNSWYLKQQNVTN